MQRNSASLQLEKTIASGKEDEKMIKQKLFHIFEENEYPLVKEEN
jgi:hypothetical protein